MRAWVKDWLDLTFCQGCMHTLAIMSCPCLSLTLVEIILSIQIGSHHHNSHKPIQISSHHPTVFQSWVGITVQSFTITSLACKSFDSTTSEWWKVIYDGVQHNLCWMWWKLQAAIKHYPFTVGPAKDSCECLLWLDLEQWLLRWRGSIGSKTSIGMIWQPRFACNLSKKSSQVNPSLMPSWTFT